MLIQVLIVRILVVRHTDLLKFEKRDGCVIYET